MKGNEFQQHQVVPSMQTDRPDDDMQVVWFLHLDLRRNGAMSISGNIDDAAYALRLLDNAKDAIIRQRDPSYGLVVPAGDVG